MGTTYSEVCNPNPITLYITDSIPAINLYLDGSWSSAGSPAPTTVLASRQPSVQTTLPGALSRRDPERANASTPGSGTATPLPPARKTMSTKRYLGSFGAVGWATKSGTGLIKHEESIGIERAKLQPRLGKGGRVRPITKKNQDVVVRFTNAKGVEVGRLENESAMWISSLLDNKMCSFEASCVYAPDRLHTGDTIYLQLRCYVLRTAFEVRKFTTSDNTEDKGLFDNQETQEERDLQLRQVALVKLFEAINLRPTRLNEATEKHKREGILQAAEMAEKEQKSKEKSGDATDAGSSPPSDEAEEGRELEQDQLDTLYKKAQSFDFNTPEMEPAATFSMSLRKYQKQALYWMTGKEKHEELKHKEAVMHPLWEEYEWPTQDADNNPLPTIDGQSMFYINPYSGDMSLDFPKQEQNCLGGILADGK